MPREAGREPTGFRFPGRGSGRIGAEMKVKGGGAPPGAAMAAAEEEEQQAARARVCKNCKRSVAAPNFPLHEAHCLRFLAVCPECEEPVALKEMKAHLARDHQQVRCPLCHQALQQFQLEHHQAEQCPERPAVCGFCELSLPFHRLGAHLEACGTRTTPCWDCGKYVMYRALEGHRQSCGARGGHSSSEGLSPGPESAFCQQCQRSVPQEIYLQHLDQCCPLPQLLGGLSTSELGSPPPPSPWRPPAEKDVRPKRKDKDLPSVLGRPSLKPPRSKKVLSRPAFTTTVPPLENPQDNEGDPNNASAYDRLAACSQCNILLPSPTLRRHQKKCQRRAPSLQAQCHRRSPRFSGKGGEESQAQAPPGENSWQ